MTRDVDIRKALLANLEVKYSDSSHDLIVEEFGCKTARADVAVINGFLHAYEIKSDSDSLDRLPSQIDAYQGVFEYVTLICGRRLLERARTAIPKWWGLQRAEFRDGGVLIHELRTAKPNPNQNPFAVARMLWKTEALAVLRRFGHRGLTSRCTAEEVWNAVAAHVPINRIRIAMRIHPLAVTRPAAVRAGCDARRAKAGLASSSHRILTRQIMQKYIYRRHSLWQSRRF